MSQDGCDGWAIIEVETFDMIPFPTQASASPLTERVRGERFSGSGQRRTKQKGARAEKNRLHIDSHSEWASLDDQKLFWGRCISWIDKEADYHSCQRDMGDWKDSQADMLLVHGLVLLPALQGFDILTLPDSYWTHRELHFINNPYYLSPARCLVSSLSPSLLTAPTALGCCHLSSTVIDGWEFKQMLKEHVGIKAHKWFQNTSILG